MSGDAPKIVLISPYTGGNLGDAAIQEAAIANIRRRIPRAEISLVSLDPAETSRLHGIESFPISRRTRPAAVYDEPTGTGVSRPANRAGTSTDRRSALRSLYVAIVPALLRRAVWKSRQRLAEWYREGRHVLLAYRFLRGRSRLVVSGGGQLDDHWGGAWGHPYALFKWSLLSQLSGVEVTVLSVGTSKLESGLTRFFIARFLGMATYRSYRDELSKQKVNFVARTRSDPVCPDLVFSYDYEVPATTRSGDTRSVAVSPITYLTQFRQSARSIRLFQQYLLDFVFFIEHLADSGYEIVVFTSADLDRPLAKDIVDRVSDRRSLAGKISACYPSTPADLFRALQGVDLVIASRLHAVLLSHIARLPVLAISYDAKVSTYMADMDMGEFMIDFADVERDALIGAFGQLTARSDELRHRLSERIPQMARSLRDQYDAVLAGRER